MSESGDVIAWLRSPEGEEWSRSRARALAALSRFTLVDDLVCLGSAQWRSGGPLDVASDPCGWTAAS